MPVSSSYFSPLRFLDTGEKPVERDRLNTDQRYRCGTQLISNTTPECMQSLNCDPRISGILKIIENFNSEPLFVGNGLFLFNKPGRFFVVGGTLTPLEAVKILNFNQPVLARLARVRPAKDENSLSLVQIVPIKDFSYQLDSTAALMTWWQTVGRNFYDGVF